MPQSQKNLIILFDGVCKFCDASVQFVIKRDKHNRFRFCTLQSSAGQRLATEFGVLDPNLTSMVLLENNKAYTKSSAALRVARYLAFPWPVLFIFIIFPPIIRNLVYDFIGNHRYQWFGKYDHCVVPDDSTREKFID